MAITRTPIVDDDGSGSTGTVIDNAWKQEFYDQIDAYVAATGIDAPPIAYTPTWTATTNPFVGDGTLAGLYVKLGKLVVANIVLTFGSTSSGGTGGWNFGLPLPVSGFGFGGGYGSTTGLILQGLGYHIGSGYVSAQAVNPWVGPGGSAAVSLDATHPATWATGHSMSCWVVYFTG